MSAPPVPAQTGAASGIDPALLAAIAAAALEVWPRPAGPAGGARAEPDQERARVWRFSGRWWARQLTARRDRPWVR